VLLALVAGIIGTTWGLVRADKARRDAVAAQLAEAVRAEGERKAKEAESAQRRRAEDNAKLATAVLDEIMKGARQRLTLYRQDEAKGLARNPEREKLEREFLEKGLRFYEQLAQTNVTDWAARRERARAYANVGLLQMDLQNYAESEKACRQAVTCWRNWRRETAGLRQPLRPGRQLLWLHSGYYDSASLRLPRSQPPGDSPF
jgi:hypothetical protein